MAHDTMKFDKKNSLYFMHSFNNWYNFFLNHMKVVTNNYENCVKIKSNKNPAFPTFWKDICTITNR